MTEGTKVTILLKMSLFFRMNYKLLVEVYSLHSTDPKQILNMFELLLFGQIIIYLGGGAQTLQVTFFHAARTRL